MHVNGLTEKDLKEYTYIAEDQLVLSALRRAEDIMAGRVFF